MYIRYTWRLAVPRSVHSVSDVYLLYMNVVFCCIFASTCDLLHRPLPNLSDVILRNSPLKSWFILFWRPASHTENGSSKRCFEFLDQLFSSQKPGSFWLRNLAILLHMLNLFFGSQTLDVIRQTNAGYLRLSNAMLAYNQIWKMWHNLSFAVRLIHKPRMYCVAGL